MTHMALVSDLAAVDAAFSSVSPCVDDTRYLAGEGS
jgi:hypothetical protein